MTSKSSRVKSLDSKQANKQATKKPNPRKEASQMETATEASNNAETKAKKKRGDGPIFFTFIDAQTKDHKRVPSNVEKVIVGSKGDKKAEYRLDALSDAMILQLAAQNIASRIKVYVTNHVNDDGSNVIELSDHMWEEFKAGNLYQREEGKGGPGRPFDPSLWVEAFRLYNANSVKRKAVNAKGEPIVAFTQEQLDMLGDKLKSMEPAKRQVVIKGYKQNEKLKACYEQAEGEAAKARIKAMGADVEDELELPI